MDAVPASLPATACADAATVPPPLADDAPVPDRCAPVNGALDYCELFEHAPVGYVLLDADGCIEVINRAGAQILGWNARWLVGKPFSRWVTNNDKQLFHTHRLRLRASADCVSQALRIKNRQGRRVSLRLKSVRESAPVGDGAARCRAIMIDISGEEQSARQLRLLQSRLTHLARLHTAGEMAACLAHELNQPLGAIVLNCEAALRLSQAGAADEREFAEILGQAAEAASFASDVVDRLRGFLRADDELHRVCTVPDVICRVAALIETEARDQDIELRLDVEHDMPDIRADPVQIGQVLVSLVHNSVEAISERDGGVGKVVIQAISPSPDWIRVSVTDTGPGLNAGPVERVFQTFYTTKRNGMGMGLAISRTIIEAHGGRLWAAPEPSAGGARFCFDLPTLARR